MAKHDYSKMIQSMLLDAMQSGNDKEKLEDLMYQLVKGVGYIVARVEDEHRHKVITTVNEQIDDFVSYCDKLRELSNKEVVSTFLA